VLNQGCSQALAWWGGGFSPPKLNVSPPKQSLPILIFLYDLLQWLRGLELSELQCSEPGWLVRQGVGSSPTPASMLSQVSACCEIKFSGRYRGFTCVLFKLWQAITPGSGASGVWWEPLVWTTDGRGQRSYRKTAYRHPARETRQLS